MAGLILDRIAALWRMVMVPPPSGLTAPLISISAPAAGTSVETLIIASVPCAILPVSTQDRNSMYSYESTHVIWVPEWLELRQEDQLRYGRRTPDMFGNVNPYVYTVNGRRHISQSIPQTAWYVTERR
jgi:hypothetical protein